MKADGIVDVEASILKARKIPCICARQFDDNPPLGKPFNRSNSRGYTVEQVQCSGCWLTWRRMNCP